MIGEVARACGVRSLAFRMHAHGAVCAGNPVSLSLPSINLAWLDRPASKGWPPC